MPSYKDTVEDMDRKYGGSYVMYGDKLCAYGNAYYKEAPTSAADKPDVEIALNCYIEKGKKEVIKVPWSDPLPWKDLMPNVQYFNISDSLYSTCVSTMNFCSRALLVYRLGRKQWIRSLSRSNCGLLDPAASLSYLRPMASALQLDYGFVLSLLNTKFEDYHSALEKVKEEYSIAISPDFAIVISPHSNEKMLLKSKYGFIGEVTHKEIDVYHHASYQEVCDLVNRHRLYLQVNKCQQLPKL